MRAVIQRVYRASVSVDGKVVGKTDKGLCIFLGVMVGDDRQQVLRLAEKISKLRIFTDENDKMNLSVNDVGGGALVISNFTLAANCRHGNRPDFLDAERPEGSIPLYEYFVSLMKERIPGGVATGIFGADMTVSVENDGPITIIIDSKDLTEIKEQNIKK